MRRQIHVRTLLLCLADSDRDGPTLLVVAEGVNGHVSRITPKVAEVNMHSGVCSQGTKVDLLSLRSLWIVLLRLEEGREVPDREDLVIVQEVLGQLLKV